MPHRSHRWITNSILCPEPLNGELSKGERSKVGYTTGKDVKFDDLVKGSRPCHVEIITNITYVGRYAMGHETFAVACRAAPEHWSISPHAMPITPSPTAIKLIIQRNHYLLNLSLIENTSNRPPQ